MYFGDSVPMLYVCVSSLCGLCAEPGRNVITFVPALVGKHVPSCYFSWHLFNACLCVYVSVYVFVCVCARVRTWLISKLSVLRRVFYQTSTHIHMQCQGWWVDDVLLLVFLKVLNLDWECSAVQCSKVLCPAIALPCSAI